MSRTIELNELAEHASSQARDAAVRAGVEVRVLDEIDEFRRASEIFESIWGTGPANAQMPAELIRALTHAGSYAAGAWLDGSMAGAVVGVLGRDRLGDHLHSHILGVDRAVRTRGVGYALKQHQRAWALEHGLRRVMWTFDPLVRRNAHFNLHKLGAEAASYEDNFYGSMTDGVNAGDESDRLFVSWRLDADRTVEAASGRLSELNADALLGGGAVVGLEADGSRAASHDAPLVLCATPENIVSVRREDPNLALRWRHALRDTLGDAMRSGYVVRGFTRSGWYVLSRDGHSAGS
ncbi:MAG TPA: GNAT family N-acetyltransferase [Actinomycetota bacterium]|nr:GNAT family N-acetyltransferase [Actinomycetota bacterium]